MVVIRSSTIIKTDWAARQLAQNSPTPDPAFGTVGGRQYAIRPGQVMFPRYIQGVGTRMMPMDPSQLPAGWQSIRVAVPSRPATCEETRCPMFLRGWTEIVAGTDRTPKAGAWSEEEATELVGTYAGRPPSVIQHPPGTECPRVHRTAVDGLPPLYEVDGRPTLFNEFEDALGGGIHTAQKLLKQGR